MMPPIHSRGCTATPADFAAITNFLLETYTLTQTLHNWDPRRWEGRIYHRNDADRATFDAQLPNQVHIWYTGPDHIVGVVIPEYDGGVFLQIHPDNRKLEAKMLDWSESHLAQTNEQGKCWIEVWSFEDDTFRNTLLSQRGYVRLEAHENIRCRDMAQPVPNMHIPEGYLVRPMQRTPSDWQHKAELLNAAFGRTFHNAEESRNFQHMPIYREDLDIMVEASDGTFAATAGFTIHERESFGILEPVCTHPEHQGKGLARAAIAEGLRRVQVLGIRTAYVGAWYSNPVSNHVYESMGFADPVGLYLWRRG